MSICGRQDGTHWGCCDVNALVAVAKAAGTVAGNFGESSEMPNRILVWREDLNALNDALALLTEPKERS